MNDNNERKFVNPQLCDHEWADLKEPHSGTFCTKCGKIPQVSDGPDDNDLVMIDHTDGELLVPTLTLEPQPINLCFNNDDGEEIGKFEYDKEKKQWYFEGDADESAKIFVKFCMAHFQSAIDGDRDGLMNQLIDNTKLCNP